MLVLFIALGVRTEIPEKFHLILILYLVAMTNLAIFLYLPV